MQIDVNDGLTPKLRSFVARLSPAGKKVLDQGASAELYALVRAHFRAYALANHASADRLGARRTGHWEEAANAMVHGVDANGAFVELKAPGIGRAVHPITVRPRFKRALTIPIHALAYGSRVADVGRKHPIFRYKNLLMTRQEGSERPIALYFLTHQVTLSKDGRMLPGKSEMSAAAAKGYKRVIASILRRQGA